MLDFVNQRFPSGPVVILPGPPPTGRINSEILVGSQESVPLLEEEPPEEEVLEEVVLEDAPLEEELEEDELDELLEPEEELV